MTLFPTKSYSPERVLALEIRARKVGYVVFEGPETMLDWGVMHKTNSHSAFERKLAARWGLLQPHAILIRRADAERSRAAVQTVRTLSRKQGVPLHFISAKNLSVHFGLNVRMNKYERAKIVADRFPELSWHLPRARKPWQSEPLKIMIFDAAALGIAYFAELRINK